MDGEGTEATSVVEGREALTPIFDDLNRYQVTTWYFQERNLIPDWSETRPCTP